MFVIVLQFRIKEYPEYKLQFVIKNKNLEHHEKLDYRKAWLLVKNEATGLFLAFCLQFLIFPGVIFSIPVILIFELFSLKNT